MSIQKYVLVWFLIASVTTVLYFGGVFTESVLLSIGFVMAALVFMGMMVVVPLSVREQ